MLEYICWVINFDWGVIMCKEFLRQEKILQDSYKFALKKRNACTSDEYSPEYIKLNKDFDSKMHKFMNFLFPR